MQEDDELRKKRILNVIYKEQYRLKLGVIYLICTKFNLLALATFYLVHKGGLAFDFAALLYLSTITIYYKFVFGLTRDGRHFDSFVLKFLSELNARIDRRLRENLKLNSASKLTKQEDENF